jgi:hypothetical protein
MISKEQICHELAMEFARVQAPKEYDAHSPLGQLEYNEKLLCTYDWCFKDLMSRRDEILGEYEKLKSEFRRMEINPE